MFGILYVLYYTYIEDVRGIGVRYIQQPQQQQPALHQHHRVGRWTTPRAPPIFSFEHPLLVHPIQFLHVRLHSQKSERSLFGYGCS